MLAELISGIVKVIFCLFVLVCVIVWLIGLFSRIKVKLTDRFGHELKNTDENIRKAYVMKLDDEELLKEIALNDYDDEVAFQAVERIGSKSVLEDIAENGRFVASRAAKRRIDEL
jgi:hypothetical protein